MANVARRKPGSPVRAAPSLAFSPDGRTLVSGDTDNNIHFWEVATTKERHTISGHQSRSPT